MAGPEAGAEAARARALAVLRIRGAALGVALVPAAVAVVLLVGGLTGRIGRADPVTSSSGWDTARWAVTGLALVVLLLAALVTAVVVRARPALSPSVPIAESSAPDLYRLVRDLADRLEVPAPSAIALTPDCDSWLEDRTHRAHAPPRGRAARGGGGAGARDGARAEQAPVLVIGSPFMWWMRVAELRALLAPVVAGTGPSANPDIAAARRFVRGLDAAVAVSARAKSPLAAPAPAFVGWVARLLLRACREHALEMERCVAAAASERAQSVDYGLRIVAQEQVGLAYAGWDRLLTRVALPAWRMGRWPSRLDAGVVSALTELSRRDRLAEGFTSRLGERPACDLLEEPGAVDRAASLLAARLFHGGPAEPGPDWSPVGWQQYPEEVVDRKWRQEAARLHRVLDALPPEPGEGAQPSRPPAEPERPARPECRIPHPAPQSARPQSPAPGGRSADPGPGSSGPTLIRVIERLTANERASDLVAARLGAELAREERAEAERRAARGPAADGPDTGVPGVPGAPGSPGVTWGDGLADGLPLFPMQPPRTGRELLADHVTAMVCCAAVDTAGAAPGLDWLDGPVLLVDGARRSDLGHPVLRLVDDGDAGPLGDWLGEVGVRPEKPVRLV
ncbi:hypothetical protein AB0B79_17195 [Streptomyces sp. NPDC039022]|uniref:hypothetical protein n=1 Tax=unclassified Streptomyces TaxID=2593676 RepID=UPI0034064E98